MRRDLPVACSGVSSLPEVAGDAAEYFDPHDAESIRAAIRLLLDSPERRAQLTERGRAQYQRFPWEETARRTLQAYREALAAS